jgi:hypothetical protein
MTPTAQQLPEQNPYLDELIMSFQLLLRCTKELACEEYALKYDHDFRFKKIYMRIMNVWTARNWVKDCEENFRWILAKKRIWDLTADLWKVGAGK